MGEEARKMTKKERTRERALPPLDDNTYERSMRARAEWTQRGLTGPVVVTQDDREWFQARQGKLFYYLCPVSHKESPLNHWRVFMQQIKTLSRQPPPHRWLFLYFLVRKGAPRLNR